MTAITRLTSAAETRVDDLTTAGGQTSRMVWIPRFRCEDIHADLGVGTHPAFIVNGSEKPGFWAGMHPGVISEGELISVEGVDPTVSTNFDTFSTAARACGTGWHVMTNAEWAAVALWQLAEGIPERGNDQYGRSYNEAGLTGRRQDHGEPGLSLGSARTLTGSGPDKWRHDGTGEGIADLVGNVWEWSAGMRLDGGDIQIIPDNNAVTADLSASSLDWVSTGLHYTTPAPGGSTNAAFSAAAAADAGDVAAAGPDLQLLRRLGLLPHSNPSTRGRLYQDDSGERLPFRGGDWGNTSNAGAFALYLHAPRSNVRTNVGARPALAI